MKFFVTVGLLCVISLVASLPAQPDELVRRRTVQPSRRLAQVSATQRRAAVRPPVSSEKNYDDYEDSEVAASDSYGAYDDTHSQFEKGVQSQADSYSTDKGVENGRLQFAIHGQQGPNTYRFGYDTGKGPNRTFRFEERDQYGVVHGRYGYYDQTGKFRIVNYSAHPEHGFKAEGDFGPK